MANFAARFSETVKLTRFVVYGIPSARDDRLRHPVFLGLWEDKNAHQVFREMAS